MNILPDVKSDPFTAIPLILRTDINMIRTKLNMIRKTVSPQSD